MSEQLNTEVAGLNLRFAVASDTDTILGLISELAEYEKLSHEMVAEYDVFKESMFGERPYAESIIAEYEGVVVGFALYFYNFSTFTGRPGIHLEDLFIKPAYRGKGFGKALLVALARLAAQRNCGRLEWSVLDWNTPSIAFYKKLGAKAMDEWTTFRLTREQLEKF